MRGIGVIWIWDLFAKMFKVMQVMLTSCLAWGALQLTIMRSLHPPADIAPVAC